MVDMGSGHLISGTTRLMHGILKALVLALGLIIGTNAYLAVFANTPYATEFTTSCASVLPVSKRDHWILVANGLLFLMVAANSASMRAAPRQFPIMMLTGAMAFWIGDAFDSMGMGYDASSLLTAFVIGIVSNGYSRLTGCPAIAPLLSGVLLLVPGSIGVRRTMAALDPTNFGAGSGFAIDFIVIAAWLSIGILGSRVLPPIENHLKPKVVKMLWDIKRSNGIDSRSVYASTIGSQKSETGARRRRPSNSSSSVYSSTSSLGPQTDRADANATPVPLIVHIPPTRPQTSYAQTSRPPSSTLNTPKRPPTRATSGTKTHHFDPVPTDTSHSPPPRPTSSSDATPRASRFSTGVRRADTQKTVATRVVGSRTHESEQPMYASNPSCSGSSEPLHTTTSEHHDEKEARPSRGRLGTIMSIDHAFRSMFARGGRGSRATTNESRVDAHQEVADERHDMEPQVTIEMSVPMTLNETVRDGPHL
ncbi:hypothetical protein BCR44DRAFT_1426079, partial [Catenaria anguillulae PL171]